MGFFLAVMTRYWGWGSVQRAARCAGPPGWGGCHTGPRRESTELRGWFGAAVFMLAAYWHVGVRRQASAERCAGGQ